jgi:predicted ATPase/class 3 adenylate cyclase/Tfp pilus assembly protein PilF
MTRIVPCRTVWEAFTAPRAALQQEITFLFTDIEGSTRLWEQEPERMRDALARHDELARSAVQRHGGTLVKMTGDGLHAAFDDALGALNATLEIQRQLADPAATNGLALPVRCGLHSGPNERRDGDFYGSVVNRAARIMSAAHGGQMLVSQAVAQQLRERLPEGVSLRELGTVRLRDLSHPERIHQVVHAGLRTEFPSLRSLEDTPNNLPEALSSFVGREREMAEIHSLLRANRLVTLVGMGGVGKSRLSLHVAAEALEDHPHGVWHVELAALREASRILHAVAAVLGIKEEVGKPVEEALARHVRDLRMLIVLDNCEHLVEGCAAASRHLLTAGAHLRILATSREPLRITGENAYVLSGLAVPGPREALTALSLERYESVQLFLERARAAAPGAIADDNATSVAAICHRLDGIPLAIELAAARVRSMSIPQIEARLKDRFRLLTTGDRTALPRQRTLRALIDWSHDLLPHDEREVFAQLAVFAGGWTLEAAEGVCMSTDDAVPDALGRLVEKSLVTFDARAERYGMLETVRQYAVERLQESGGEAAARDRHLAFFAEVTRTAKPHLSGPTQGEWLDRLDRERENILSAHEWAGNGEERAQLGLRLLNGLKLYWSKRGLLPLADRVMTAALARPGAQAPNLARAQTLFHVGSLRYFAGRPAEARAPLEESLAIARQLGDPRGIATVLQSLGMTATAQGDLEAAHRFAAEAVETARNRGDKPSLAGALTALAMLYRVQGQPERAAPLYEQVIELAREAGDVEVQSVGFLNHAMLALDKGETNAARRMVRQALDGTADVPSRPAIQSALDVCAAMASLQGDWRRAARLFGAAEAQAQETGFRRDTADALFLEPKIRKAQAMLDDRTYRECESAGRKLGHLEAIREIRECLESVTATAERLTSP